MSVSYKEVIDELMVGADEERARNLSRFFKTGPGEYGEGDVFLGLNVGAVREVARRARGLELDEVRKLVAQPEHEVRQCGLFVLVDQWRRARGEEAAETRLRIYEFYLEVAHAGRVNNWDLVDLTAPTLVGKQLLAGDRAEARRVLRRLARSENLWERRIAMLACAAYIDAGDAEMAFDVVELLKDDREDLIHKATGWMLREIGKKCGQEVLEEWLRDDGRRYARLPRTMLRYAIERFDEGLRQRYLKGEV